MATKAPPVGGLSMVSLRPTYSNRFQPLKSSFVSYGVGALNAPQLRIAHSNRLRCNCQGGGAFGAQMNLFSRFARIVKSYANAILSSFEDPEKIIEQAVLDMNNDLIKMRQATAQVWASQRQLNNKYETAHKASEDWYRRAELALTKGNEDLAREALKRRKGYAENASALKAQLDQQKIVVDNLVSNTRLLESKIQEAKSKKDVFRARAQSAKTLTRVSELVGDIDTSSALHAFNKMEDKVLAMESEADAYSQLITDDLEGKIQLLERSFVDDELESLKKKLSGSSMKAELPPGRTTVAAKPFPFRDSDIENELNQLRRKAKEF
ncbi:membrane-associated protein VIPP1, chloroplastic isoform X2 [Ziziphus jujuba]|uniref:Membrane-associated protein VIPP1, chloroplastic isoform X2 n=1 Tax=Ziziphus jujuba TaxID=326968 RepID=A0A6P3ZDK7_ZIZJJ|nr:membrane-associated protein VIPP1, chloroplastic isoform X2 [Ziziphus jujuba]